MKYAVVIEKGPDSFGAYAPDLPGCGYQTLINNALRRYLSNASQPVDSKTLRRILREELNKTN